MKRLLCILTLLCVLAGLCVLPLSAAEGNVTVRYGAEDLSLTLIDPLDDAGLTFDGSFGFGVATVQNGVRPSATAKNASATTAQSARNSILY